MKKQLAKTSLLAILACASTLPMLAGCGGSSTVPVARLYALSNTGKLYFFSANSPQTALFQSQIMIGSSALILDSIEFSPVNKRLYGTRYNSPNIEFYEVDASTGQATLVSSKNMGTIYTRPNALSYDPTSGAFDITQYDGSPNFLSLRANSNGSIPETSSSTPPTSGTLWASFQMVDTAHTNQRSSSSSTAGYAVDVATGNLFRLGSAAVVNPIFGNAQPAVVAISAFVPTLIGPLGVSGGTRGGFDIDAVTGNAYLGFALGTTSTLYKVNLSTGAASSVGTIQVNSGETVVGLAVIE